MRNILLLLLLPLLVACQASEFKIAQGKYIKEMDWLYSAKPRDDVEKAIKNKDFRFMGVYGYSISVPGIKIKCLDRKKQKKRVRS
ncbi:MAG TPA: hypothetical protein EYH06_08520 [Chromatiales bacterium]|nr:hypothetical protein [Thiotrichales bacterium]HIP68619.1 hypothetical protein [Chromatiales bacterium]